MSGQTRGRRIRRPSLESVDEISRSTARRNRSLSPFSKTLRFVRIRGVLRMVSIQMVNPEQCLCWCRYCAGANADAGADDGANADAGTPRSTNTRCHDMFPNFLNLTSKIVLGVCRCRRGSPSDETAEKRRQISNCTGQHRSQHRCVNVKKPGCDSIFSKVHLKSLKLVINSTSPVRRIERGQRRPTDGMLYFAPVPIYKFIINSNEVYTSHTHLNTSHTHLNILFCSN